MPHVAHPAQPSLTRKASVYLPEEDLRRIRDAYRLSDEAHLGQFRTSEAWQAQGAAPGQAILPLTTRSIFP